MAIPIHHLAEAVYLICLLWLATICILHLSPKRYAATAKTIASVLWWLLLAFSLAYISPTPPWPLPGWEGTGYALLPMVTLAAGITSFAGFCPLWWRLLLVICPSVVLIAAADYMSWPAIASALAFWGLLSIGYRRAMASWGNHGKLRVLRSTVIGAAVLAVAALVAQQWGANLSFEVALVSLSALLASPLIAQPGWQDRQQHLLVTVPVILAMEWALFGY